MRSEWFLYIFFYSQNCIISYRTLCEDRSTSREVFFSEINLCNFVSGRRVLHRGRKSHLGPASHCIVTSNSLKPQQYCCCIFCNEVNQRDLFVLVKVAALRALRMWGFYSRVHLTTIFQLPNFCKVVLQRRTWQDIDGIVRKIFWALSRNFCGQTEENTKIFLSRQLKAGPTEARVITRYWDIRMCVF
jgi:predicted nucleic acid-binding Zn ribbon protein